LTRKIKEKTRQPCPVKIRAPTSLVDGHHLVTFFQAHYPDSFVNVGEGKTVSDDIFLGWPDLFPSDG
jgi:hypothetical protein